MTTLQTSTHTVKVSIRGSRKQETPLLEGPLTEDTLALLAPHTPLSKAILDGAGLPYRPREVAVYIDGELAWRKRCPIRGATDLVSSGRHGFETFAFTDAFPQAEYTDELAASNRAAWESWRGRAASVEELADSFLDEVDADKPELALVPRAKPSPRALPPAKREPCPCESPGLRGWGMLGLPYRPAGSWRRVRCSRGGPGVEYDFEFPTAPK